MTRRPLATVRARFVALLLIAAAPLFVTGAAIAYQNAEVVADSPVRAVLSARVAIGLRQKAFVSEGERLLVAVSLAPVLLDGDGQACSAGLASILNVAGERYLRLVTLGPQDRIRCSAGPSPVPASLEPGETSSVTEALANGRLAVGRIAAVPSGQVALPIALAVPPSPGAAGTASTAVLATINEQRLLIGPDGPMDRTGLRAWMLPDPQTSRAISLVGPADEALPTEAGIARLQAAASGPMRGDSRGGRPYVFALSEVLPGLRLLLAAPATAAQSAADRILGQRLAELGLVLLAGLAVVAFGADLTVGRPLKQVARAVGRWRAGGRFEPGSLRHAPIEISALAQSFGEATAALGQREQQLRDATAHQELLMQEIHHRVKNNLQVVASLLNLQASRIRQPAARAEFHAARDRIRALATLHRHLYAHGELHTINMRGFLEELCDQLLQAMGESPAGGRIALTIEAPELQISSDQAVPMALLVTEAVSNAVKYAFPGGRSGHIAVRLALIRGEDGQEIARLSIDDDGVGIPAGRSDTDAGIRDGLGLTLIRGFARQLGSTLEVGEGPGTHYTVNILLRRERAAGDPTPDDHGIEDEAA